MTKKSFFKERTVKEIQKLNLKFGSDFLYVIGSTTAEFWFLNRIAEEKTLEMLKKLKYGRIISQKDFKIKTNSIIFLADFKTAFFPNSFSNYHFKAMHGWNPREQKTLYIIAHKDFKGEKNARMIDMLPTILRIMNLPRLNCDGKSLI